MTAEEVRVPGINMLNLSPTPSLVMTANLWLSDLSSELKFTAEREVLKGRKVKS